MPTNTANTTNELDDLLGLSDATQPPAGPSREWLKKMADAEDRCGSTSVGGLAVECGQPIASDGSDGSGFPPDFAKPRLLTNPISGATIDLQSVDSLLEHFAILNEMNKQVYATLNVLRERIGAMTDGTNKTRRLVGSQLRVKVEMPSDSWNNAKLKEAWNAYPAFAGDYLKISAVDPQIREVNKLKTMTVVDNPAFEVFRDIVLGANQGPTGLPKVTIEG